MFRRLFLNRNLALLWAGQIVAKFGESLFNMALVFTSLALTADSDNAGVVAGLIQMSSYLPILLFGLVAGTLVDRSSKKSVMLIADAGRGVLVVLIPALFYVHSLTPLTLASLAFGITALSAFFTPARNASVPDLAAERGASDAALLQANSLIQTSEQIAFLLAPLAVGVLTGWLGIVPLFFFTSATFFISYFFIASIGFQPDRFQPDRFPLANAPSIAEPPVSTALDGRTLIRDSLKSIIRVSSHKAVRTLLVITSVNNFLLMGAAIVGTPLLIRDGLGIAGDDGIRVYALIEFVFAVSMLAVSFLLNIFSSRVQKIGYKKIWAFGLFADGVSYCPYAFIETVPQLAAFALLHATFIILIIIPRTTLLQRLTPPRDLGNVFSLLNVAVSGVTALSCAVTGWACTVFGVRDVFLFIGMLSGLCGVWAWLVPDSLFSAAESAPIPASASH